VPGGRRGLIPSGVARYEHSEVLRVEPARLAVPHRGRDVCGDTHAGVSEMGVQDVRAVPRRGHPRCHHRPRGGEAEGAPRNVLAHFAPFFRRDVAGGAHTVQGGVPARADVFEVVLGRHAVAVALGRLPQLCVLAQRGLAVAFAFLVDEAFDGRAHLFEIARGGGCVGVGARLPIRRRGSGYGWRGAQGEGCGQGHACQGGQREAEASHGLPIGSWSANLSPCRPAGRFVAVSTAPTTAPVFRA
jgi:hypothetical protein